MYTLSGTIKLVADKIDNFWFCIGSYALLDADRLALILMIQKMGGGTERSSVCKVSVKLKREAQWLRDWRSI